ncbi:MAG: NAD(P)H-hydrate epimerase [Candidatus Marinimicrobia bacterium]|nr:NAD(P)H-hydrate epimerase [Candidatus Neomarinimicrobiota bacterium]MBL7010609.1 NAD(P)H-hydrate epimerase [Candidatus Neomarinimicrobiota bacterium]MBL7030094.1 NAD(P)H-hydrate epimerase [Candidatus Neomarinimicrobiota bacterium]
MTQNKIPAITADQMQLVDQLMLGSYGIQLEQMMEMAGRNLSDLAFDLLSGSSCPKIIVVCGGGHNGGGGLVAARHLSNRGAEVTVVLTAREGRLKEVPFKRWNTLKKLSVDLISANKSDPLGVFQKADLIIDAIIGYGLTDEPRGIPAHVIREILNSQNKNVLSLDVPSGLNATDGSFTKLCIHAKATMTLALPKTGLSDPEAKKCVGDLYLADIGVPPGLYSQLGLPNQFLFKDKSIIKI